jgi:hypothetical protein
MEEAGGTLAYWVSGWQEKVLIYVLFVSSIFLIAGST